MPDRESLRYRPCVGVFLFNQTGRVFVAQREDTPGAWQMPQGGIDKGEDPAVAALRELEEETGVRSAKIVARTEGWICYDFPDSILANASRGKWRGQKQIWFACRFIGIDDEINLNAHAPAEFTNWRWSNPEMLAELIVPFKRKVYEQVIESFSPILRDLVGK